MLTMICSTAASLGLRGFYHHQYDPYITNTSQHYAVEFSWYGRFYGDSRMKPSEGHLGTISVISSSV